MQSSQLETMLDPAARMAPPRPGVPEKSTPFPDRCAQLFQVERLLASGSFGSVYQATQNALNRRVVVKLLHRDLLHDAGQVQRFTAEAKITAAFNHKNIVVVIDYGYENGVPWIAYEYRRGGKNDGWSASDCRGFSGPTPSLLTRKTRGRLRSG